MPTFTVLMPTFNNCESLRYSIPSVLNQDFSDFELFLVGDGCPADSREIIESFARQDKRVVFCDNPKGPRHGEGHRHSALQHAQGRYVSYLSDDDLFLPQHLATVLRSFEQGFNFVHALPIHIIPDSIQAPNGTIAIPELDGKKIAVLKGALDISESVESIRRGRNFLSLSSVSHSIDLYRKLPHGWRTTPEGIFTDLYMWQQFIELPDLKATSTNHATVIHCAKGLRAEWSPASRLREIIEWSQLLDRPELGALIENAALSACLAGLVANVSTERNLCHQIDELRGDVSNAQHFVGSLQSIIQEKDATLGETLRRLNSIYTSLTWRAAERLRRVKLFKAAGRTIASYLSR